MDKATHTLDQQLQPALEPGPLPDNVCITDSEPAFKVIQESVLGLWEVVNALSTV